MLGIILGSLLLGCEIEGRYDKARQVGTETGQLLCKTRKINQQVALGNDMATYEAAELEKWAADLERKTKDMSDDEVTEAMKRFRAEVFRCQRDERKKNDK